MWVQSWYVLLLNFDNSNSRTENNALILSLLPSVCLQVRKYQKHEISFLGMFIFSLIRYLLIVFHFFWSGKIQGLLLKPYFTFEKKKWYWRKYLLKKKSKNTQPRALCGVFSSISFISLKNVYIDNAQTGEYVCYWSQHYDRSSVT